MNCVQNDDAYLYLIPARNKEIGLNHKDARIYKAFQSLEPLLEFFVRGRTRVSQIFAGPSKPPNFIEQMHGICVAVIIRCIRAGERAGRLRIENWKE